MKIKKFFFAIAMTLFVGGASTTMVSCNDDDVKTVLELVDMLFSSTDELAGTIWVDDLEDPSIAFAFQSGQTGSVAIWDEESGETEEESFTYTLDTQNNTLSIKLSEGTLRYTISDYKAQSYMKLSDGKSSFTLRYYGAAQ
ncbi:MAG: hypothetical protein K5896_10935 [Prevotella sp.]|jgi:hypothetical protein|nr:hypothetical protein [Prevotella sp.]